MTVDAATPTSTYQISGVGPYDVPWPYEGGDVVVWAFLGNAQLQLSEGIHWTLTPDAGSSGTITLSPDTAETWDGGTLSIQRDSVAEQGWAGTTSRERGLEASLDRLTRLAQELKALSETALRLVGNSRLPPINTPEAGQTILFDGEAFVPGPAIDQIEAAAEAARYINSAIVGAAITGTVAAVDTPVALPVAGAAVQQVYVGNARQWPPDDWEQVGDTILFKRDYHVGQTYHLTYLVPSEGQTAFATRIALQAARPTMTLPVGTTVTAEGLTYRVEAITFNKIPDMPGLSAVDPTVFHYGAVGGGIIDDTQAFTRAAAAHLQVKVPAVTGGYKVNDTVVNNQCMFIFEGAFYSTQIVGTATRHQLRAVSIHNGQYSMRQLRVEPEKNMLTGSNEGSRRGIFVDMAEPNLASTDYGDGPWNFNEIRANWRGQRTGTGIDGSGTSATVRSLYIGMDVGGADFDLQSVGALSLGTIHTEDDTCDGDKVGGTSGVYTSASSPGKIYGWSNSFTVDSGGVTPRAFAHESDCFIKGTGSVINAAAYHAWSGGDAQASNTYAAYLIGISGAAGAARWKSGLVISSGTEGTPIAGKQPIDTDGTLFDCDNNITIKDIFRFNEPDRVVTVTGDILGFENVTLTGDGALDLVGPITGTAVTQTATDNTAGRLLKVGDSATLLAASPVLRVTYGGTADAITLTTGAGFSGTPPTGMELRFRATATNTGPATLALDGGTPRTILTANGQSLPAGYLRTDRDTVVRFGGTNWIASREIERGTGANGSWERFEDGFQTVRIAIVSSAIGAVTWTYEKPFSVTPNVQLTPISAAPREVAATSRGTSSCEVNCWDLSAARQSNTVDATAEGFWF